MVSISGDYTETQETHDGVEFTRIRANSGRTLILIEDGDTFENYLFDQQNSGAYVQIVTQMGWDHTPPASYTLRNIGWLGEMPNSSAGAMVLSCTNEATAENIYLGDGHPAYPVSGSWNNYPTGILASLKHSGHLHYRGVTLANWSDNAMYCSPPAHPGDGNGTFTVENAHSIHSQISCFRFGTNTTLRNCYGRTKSGDHRVLWAYENSNTNSSQITVENSVFDAHNAHRAIEHHSTASVSLDGQSYYTGHNGGGSVSGGQQTSSPPERTRADVGAPESALAAAIGAVADPTVEEPEPNPPDSVGTLDVATRAPRDIDATSARLRGQLVDLDDETADVYFEWRKVDE